MEGLRSMYVKCFLLQIKYVSSKRLSKPWVTPGILKSIKTKSHYFKLCKLGAIDRNLNNRYRNKLNSVIRQAKQYYLHKVFRDSTNNIKETWEIIRKLLSGKPSAKSIKSLLVDNVAITDSSCIAESFNEYFVNVADDLERNTPDTDASPTQFIAENLQSSLSLHRTTRSEIVNIIGDLKIVLLILMKFPLRY